ncbi:MAG: DUF3891 family protein [Deltaproteobacteria bacterium]
MIRRETEGGWILIAQHDHALLSAEIMERWGNGDFAAADPFDEVMFAVREHDAGWQGWDSLPKINPQSLFPMNFMEMDFHDQKAIWTECFNRHRAARPYASALIALHFGVFSRRIASKNPSNGSAEALRNEMNRFVSETLQSEISNLDASALSRDVQVNLRLVQIGDVISLALCHGWSITNIGDVPTGYSTPRKSNIAISCRDGLNFTMTPYPFAENSVKFEILGRELQRRTFSSNDELRQALSESDTSALRFSIERG